MTDLAPFNISLTEICLRCYIKLQNNYLINKLTTRK